MDMFEDFFRKKHVQCLISCSDSFDECVSRNECAKYIDLSGIVYSIYPIIIIHRDDMMRNELNFTLESGPIFNGCFEK